MPRPANFAHLTTKILVLPINTGMDEQFSPIEGYPGYRVSSSGEVQSCWVRRGTASHLGASWRAMKPYLSRGYAKVKLSKDGREDAFRIHRLVLLAFVGPAPEGMIGLHNDGNPTNNRLENLRWDSPRANSEDARLHGTLCRGESARHAKLREADVLEIRRLRAEGLTTCELANRFEVSPRNVRVIVQGHSWRHLLPLFEQGSEGGGRVERGLAA